VRQKEIPGFPELFMELGVPLSSKAKAKVDDKDLQWTITEADGQANAGLSISYGPFANPIV